MTVTDIHDAPSRVNGDDAVRVDTMTDAEKREAARELARRDPDIGGAELATRFRMKPAWGRDQANIARHGTRRGRAASGTASRTDAPPEYGPPAPARGRPRVNGTARTPAPATTPRPAKPKPTAPLEPLPPAAKALVVVTKVAVAVVAVVAAVVSYSHTRDLAVMVGQTRLLAGVIPLAVDGLVIAGSTSLLVDRHNRRPGSPWAGLAVVIGLASSMAANVVAVDPTLIDLRAVRWVMAAYAPVALAIAGHLLLRMLDQPQDRKDQP